MKVKRSDSLCSDAAPSSPDSIDSGDRSPAASPEPPSDSVDFVYTEEKDRRLYSPAYSSERSPEPSSDYNYLPSPSYGNASPHYSYSSFEYPPSPECCHSPGYSPYSSEKAAPGYIDESNSREHQAEFMKAVQSGNPKELKQILASYSQMVQINGFTRDGQTALTQSCLDGNLEVVKLLVSHGASVRLTNRDGFSPLHVACWCGKVDVMQYLLTNAESIR